MDYARLLHHTIFGGLAAAGFAVLFNIGGRALPWCGASGALAVAVRTVALAAGWSLEAASFAAALAVGCAVQLFQARIGVTVLIPKATFHPQVRLLPLPDFPVPIFGVLWQGRPTAVVNAFLDAVRRATTALFAQGDASLLLLPGGEDKERAAP